MFVFVFARLAAMFRASPGYFLKSTMALGFAVNTSNSMLTTYPTAPPADELTMKPTAGVRSRAELSGEATHNRAPAIVASTRVCIILSYEHGGPRMAKRR